MPGKSLPHTKQAATSADLEWGSDSLSRIYKAMTPGQEDAVMEADYLTELGNRPYPWRMTIKNSDYYQAQFTIPETGMVYKVRMWATKYPAPRARRPDGSITPSPARPPAQWEFGFGLYKAADHAWDSLAQGTDDIVGNTRVEIPVFATVVDIFKAMVKTAAPLSIVYTAKVPSRQRLYSRFTRMIQRVVPGYKGFEVKSGSYEVRRDGYVAEEQEQAMSIPTFREYLRESTDATPPIVTDVPPPEMESWMRKNKASYVKQHGEETGLVRLTAAAWDIHNREKAERDSSMEPTA
jgi:hypothetical protein